MTPLLPNCSPATMDDAHPPFGRTSDLLSYARRARDNAYAPYSKFAVGAAVETEDGSIFTGVNVENASYGLTICAERSAIFAAVTDGHTKIKTLAVATGGDDDSVSGMPCGACRQVMAEFMGDEAVVFIGDGSEMRLAELFPHPFRLNPAD